MGQILSDTMYNSAMNKITIRRLVGIFILLISLGLLLWGLWPFSHAFQSLPITPSELRLPTPQGFAPGWLALF
jgi:uncharacterized membrane protein YidH (DUF202 family)